MSDHPPSSIPCDGAPGRNFYAHFNFQVPANYQVDAGCEIEVPNPNVTASAILSATGESPTLRCDLSLSQQGEYPGREPTWTSAAGIFRSVEPAKYDSVEFYCGDAMIGSVKIEF